MALKLEAAPKRGKAPPPTTGELRQEYHTALQQAETALDRERARQAYFEALSKLFDKKEEPEWRERHRAASQ